MLTNRELDILVEVLDEWNDPFGKRTRLNHSEQGEKKYKMKTAKDLKTRLKTIRKERNNTCHHGTMFA